MRWDDWDESDSEGQVEDRRDEPGGADSEGITPQAAGDASATADRSGPPRSFSERMWDPGMGQAPEGSLEAQAGFNDLPDQQGYINQLLQYGREKFNLTGGDNDADDQGGAPDNDADDQQSFRAGGPVEDDEDEALTTGGTQEQPQEQPQQQGGTSLGDVAGAAGQGVMNAMPGGFLASANNRQAVGDAAGQAWEGVKGAASSVANWAGDVPKRFMSYLTRADAAPHAAIKGLEQEVDPSGQMDPNDRSVAAVKAAEQANGQEGAWQALQGYLKRYDVFKADAARLIQEGNLPEAAKSLNNAMASLPDGNRVQFRPAQGVQALEAIVTGKDGQQNVVYMSPDNLMKLTRGKEGMADQVLAQGSAAAVQALGQQQGQQGQPPQGPQRGQVTGRNDVNAVPDNWARRGVTQDEWDSSNQQFPWISQESQRLQGLETRLKDRRDQDIEANKNVWHVEGALSRERSKKYEADQKANSAILVAGLRNKGVEIKSAADYRARLDSELVRAASRVQDAQLRGQYGAAREILKGITLGAKPQDMANAYSDALAKQGINLQELIAAQGRVPTGMGGGQPQGQPPAGGQQPQQYQEGQTATNSKTGERRVYRGGKWVPVE